MTQQQSRYVKYLQADRISRILEEKSLEVDFDIKQEGMTTLRNHNGYGIHGQAATVTISAYSRPGRGWQHLAALEHLLSSVSDPVVLTSDELSARVIGLSSTGVVWKVHFFGIKTNLDPKNAITLDELKEALDVHE